MINNISITFILPGHGKNPVGGFKVVYEYANHLVARGHSINIVHPAILYCDTPIYQMPKKWVRFVQRKLDKSYLPNRWFKIDKRVNMLWVRSLMQKNIPDADVVIATAWQTAESVSDYDVKKGRKFYFIQDFEEWSGPQARLEATWKLPLNKIVISRWLQDIAERFGQSATYIPNGLDFSAFGVDTRIESRDAYSVVMLYHHLERKGIDDGLKALDIVRQSYPKLKVTLFGVPNGRLLPKWISYKATPSQKILREIYNNAAIFLAPSRAEGWGLTASEAMICGAAIVGTNIGGHQEFMEDGVTALLAPAHSPQALAERLLVLLSDTNKRIDIAKNGNQFIQRFTWDKAVDALEAALSHGGK